MIIGAVMRAVSPGQIVQGKPFRPRLCAFGITECVRLVTALRRSRPWPSDLVADTFAALVIAEPANSRLLWHLPQSRGRLTVLRVACLVNQKAVCAVSSPLRFGAARADDACRSCRVMRLPFSW